jgi:hypothetical protein
VVVHAKRVVHTTCMRKEKRANVGSACGRYKAQNFLKMGE